MFQKVDQAAFLSGEHEVLRFWKEHQVFDRLRAQNHGGPKWSFLDGPITANNPMGVHHAWGRTYKDAYQRYRAMTGHDLRYQNGFDCQGLWVEVEVEKDLQLGTKKAIETFGIDAFTRACKQRVLRFAARQTEQSIRLGYWMEWDDPDELRKLADAIQEVSAHGETAEEQVISYRTARGQTVSGPAEQIAAQLGSPEWGGSYFTFSTENNETIWTFLKKCFERAKIYRGHDVMPWGGRSGSAYSQMEVADGRRLTTHRSCFVRFPLLRENTDENEYLLVWTTTPWTLTANVAAAVNPELEYLRIRARQDGAIYYFARENLNFKRLEKEYQEGFGRPEWQWPDGVPRLKTLAQIFKEQGGCEELGVISGADMVGWRYRGPFDELPAQQQAFSEAEETLSDSAAGFVHRVIDGGRDSKGSANVVAGEGTGIVHIAPGCGDIDHQIGMELGLPVIAPLLEDGTYGTGFGPFTGKNAIAPETADQVFSELKAKGLLLSVETYPHIYPHCWRTGDELVFRLVDEWFINMDWRSEIQEVTRCINWLPESIQGQQRELEWLETMRDWMISKKRFWGLALPIWVDPENPSDFEVIGSLAELQERAVEGWEEFEGHTPHRPWIDKVKIRSQQTGAVLSRIEDVGNPWLDAGIVPFSTMNYRASRKAQGLSTALNWQDWFPADFVVECFPGQFRNWFYSLLALATMMRYDEAGDPEQKKPFKNLLGHRLVMDENGRPMHKSDGTAIWFEEAAEQLGVDTLRWLYLTQNPATDLRFGLRHPDQPVTLETVEGQISATKEGLPTCKVTSKPADEIRRQVLIPLWNSYAFFVNYAILDGFDPALPAVPLSERPEIDRWILSRLQELTRAGRQAFEEYRVADFMQAAAVLIDDLSNWYIRRNRRRFWKAVEETASATENRWETDKLAAYQTLYHVLLTLSRLLAPAIPFLTERMYRNLRTDDDPLSVHLCPYPEVDAALLDSDLNWKTQQVQTLVRLAHRLRETHELRVRQPLAELRFATSDARQAEALEQYQDVIADELNVKAVVRADNLDDLVSYVYKPNLKTLGPKYGKLLNAIRQELGTLDAAVLAPLRRGESVSVTIGGAEVMLAPEDVMVSVQQASDWASADDSGIQVALSTVLSDELIQEGMARDLVRQVQQLRKEADLEENQRIVILWSPQQQAQRALAEATIAGWERLILAETRSESITEAADAGESFKDVAIGDVGIQLAIRWDQTESR